MSKTQLLLPVTVGKLFIVSFAKVNTETE